MRQTKSFSCTRVQNMWRLLILNLHITWSHIFLGLILNENDGTCNFNKTGNNIITNAAYSIYATWVKCGNDKEDVKYIDLIILFGIKFYTNISKNKINGSKYFFMYIGKIIKLHFN